MLGQVIGNYRVEAEIGRGGMGVVYRAVHVHMDRTVAIKALLPQFAGDKEVRRRLFQEQRILDRLRHANIVALHDVYSDEDSLYLVMEFIEGTTLDQVVLDDGPMPFLRVASMGQQLLGALAFAHSRGVVHRDIKPPNIILTRSEAKLLDFGIAKAADAARLTSPDLVVGSPAYLPPELWNGEDASPRSDVYALGLCLYEGVMGKPALSSTSGWQAFYALHTQTDIPHLGGRLPERWKWLADAIHTATRRDPAARYADGKAMLRLFRKTSSTRRAPVPSRSWARVASRSSHPRRLLPVPGSSRWDRARRAHRHRRTRRPRDRSPRPTRRPPRLHRRLSPPRGPQRRPLSPPRLPRSPSPRTCAHPSRPRRHRSSGPGACSQVSGVR